MEILRRQLSESRRRADIAAEHAHKNLVGTSPSSSRHGVTGLKLRVQERIRQLDRTNPDFQQKSQRIFVESILAWELGEQILRDPQFERLVDQVNMAMASQPEIQAQMNELLSSNNLIE